MSLRESDVCWITFTFPSSPRVPLLQHAAACSRDPITDLAVSCRALPGLDRGGQGGLPAQFHFKLRCAAPTSDFGNSIQSPPIASVGVAFGGKASTIWIEIWLNSVDLSGTLIFELEVADKPSLLKSKFCSCLFKRQNHLQYAQGKVSVRDFLVYFTKMILILRPYLRRIK